MKGDKKFKILFGLMVVTAVISVVVFIWAICAAKSYHTASIPESVLGGVVYVFVVLIASGLFMMVGGTSSYVGFIVSYKCRKKAENKVQKRIATVCLCIHSVIAALIVGLIFVSLVRIAW